MSIARIARRSGYPIAEVRGLERKLAPVPLFPRGASRPTYCASVPSRYFKPRVKPPGATLR